MHAFMHYHMAKHAQWNRKIMKICSIKIQFYIILHFYFPWNNAQLIFLQIVFIEAHAFIWLHFHEHRKWFFYITRSDRCILKWRNLGQSESVLNFIAISKHTASCVFFFFLLFGLSLDLPILSLSLSFSLVHSFIREKINKMHYYAS